MGEAKVSREVAVAIKQLIDGSWTVKEILEAHAADKTGWCGDKVEALNNLSIYTLSQALFNGYEIEEKFKVGDFTLPNFPLDSGMIIEKLRFEEIKDIKRVDGKKLIITDNGNYAEDQLRLATEEEVFWMKKLDRIYVGDFYTGDILILKAPGEEVKVVGEGFSPSMAEAYYKSGEYDFFYPNEFIYKNKNK